MNYTGELFEIGDQYIKDLQRVKKFYNTDDSIDMSYLKSVYYDKDDEIYDIKMFMQTWSSTALGFGGIGGQMMTNASTICIFWVSGYVDIFFGGSFAYRKYKTDALLEDIKNESLVETYNATRKYARY